MNIRPVERTCCMVWMYGSQPEKSRRFRRFRAGETCGNCMVWILFWRFCAKFCMSILCLCRYMRISIDLSFVAIGYLYHWCSLCFSSFTTEMAFKFNISSFIIHYIMIFIYTVYLSLWYTFNTLHMYHTSLVLETYPNYSKLMSHFIAPLLDQVGDTETSTIKTGVEEQTSRQK